MPDFRLISITLKNSEEFDEGTYNFSVESITSKSSSPFITLIIGPNGSGKSRLLKIVLDIFNDLYNYKETRVANYRFKEWYLLKYSYNKSFYEIENDRKLKILKNEALLGNINEIELPLKGIAAAYSLYEKFTPKAKSLSLLTTRKKTRYDNDFYEYLGGKTERNFSFSGSYINKAIDLITNALAHEGFKKEMGYVFQVLHFQPRINLKYKVTKNREFFNGQMDVTELRALLSINSNRNYGFSSSMFSLLNNSSDQYLNDVAEALNGTHKLLTPKYEIDLEIPFGRTQSLFELRRLYKYVSILRDLNLIYYENIFVYKRDRRDPNGYPVDLKNMSSGEIQILTSLLTLSSIVQDSSLVLIDEPEISLHPNWQIQYINILNNVFRGFRGCHFLIASHSHFLVSDMKHDSSAILILNKNNKHQITSEYLKYNTEGWDAENILYNVFDVATTRNHYFEMDLRNLLKLISKKNSNKTKIRDYIAKFEQFNITTNDPLTLIIKKAKKYIQ